MTMEAPPWRMAERLFYLGVIAFLQWRVYWQGVDFSGRLSSATKMPGLQHSSLLGTHWQVDLSDVQWRDFRGGLPLLAAVMAAFVAASHVVAHKWGSRARLRFYQVTSLAFLGVLHGSSCVHVLALLGANYVLARFCAGKQYGALILWAFNLACMLLVKAYDGLPYALLSPSLAALDRHRGLLRWHVHFNLVVLRMLSYGMDLHWARTKRATWCAEPTGTPPQPWHDLKTRSELPLPLHHYTFASYLPYCLYPPLYIAGPILTFNAWGSQLAAPPSSSATNPKLLWTAPTPSSDNDGSSSIAAPGASTARTAAGSRSAATDGTVAEGGHHAIHDGKPSPSAPATAASASAAAAAPSRAPGGPTRPRSVLLYALRWLLSWAVLEALTHTTCFNSVAKYRVLEWLARVRAQGGPGLGPLGAPELQPRPLLYALTAYWVLVFMWLKFLVIWRFFRLVALADGVDVPENMTRCVCDNYDVEGFWRGWHCSYNAWLVRYLYVPLGGARWRAANVWAIFTFVALWHDLELRLIGWAWIMALAIAPEMAVKHWARGPSMRRWRGTWAFRQLQAAAAAVNIFVLMAGNLVGFVVGLDGVRPMLQQVLGHPSFLAVVFCAFFSAAQLMLWRRDVEAERAATTGSGSGSGPGPGPGSGLAKQQQ